MIALAATTVAPAAAVTASAEVVPSWRAPTHTAAGASARQSQTTSLNASGEPSGPRSAIRTAVPTLSRSKTVAPSG